ncbi:MAG: hypothetical protein LBM70_06315 [Victivallales bacterium]|jgi:hypothetical protein|nr:hypothetical protein [Victivallales bacterium]
MIRLVLLAGVFALLGVVGCTDIDYVGREFESTPVSEQVAYYVNRELIPPGEFRIMGRVTITAPDGTDGYDIQELLQKKAREYGADAVALVEARKIPVGVYEKTETPKALNSDNPASRRDADAQKAEIKEYGEPVKLSGERNFRLEVVIEALFLKKKTTLEELTKDQDAEVKEILGVPSEPARIPAPTPTLPQGNL